MPIYMKTSALIDRFLAEMKMNREQNPRLLIDRYSMSEAFSDMLCLNFAAYIRHRGPDNTVQVLIREHSEKCVGIDRLQQRHGVCVKAEAFILGRDD